MILLELYLAIITYNKNIGIEKKKKLQKKEYIKKTLLNNENASELKVNLEE